MGEVAYEDARRHFADHIKERQVTVQTEVLTVEKLIDYFLEWIEESRSTATYRTRKRECSSFGRFRYGDRKISDIPALEVPGDMLKAWREILKTTPVKDEVNVNDKEKRGLNTQAIIHAETSVRHAFNWGCKYPSPTGAVAPFPGNFGKDDNFSKKTAMTYIGSG